MTLIFFFLKILIKNLFLTLLIELLISFILGFRDKDILTIALCNVVTNPIVNALVIIFSFYFNNILINYFILIILETLVFIVEGIMFNNSLTRTNINPYLLSFILNISSFLIPLFLN